MNRVKHIFLFLAVFCGVQNVQAETTFFIGAKAGTLNPFTLDSTDGEETIDNDGFGSNFEFGVELTGDWRVGFSHLDLQDIETPFFRGDDLQISVNAIIVDKRINDNGSLFIRPRAGLLQWKGKAGEESEIFFIDLTSDDPVRFENKGTSALLGLELGMRFTEFFEFTFVGYERVLGSDLTFGRTYTGISFYF